MNGSFSLCICVFINEIILELMDEEMKGWVEGPWYLLSSHAVAVFSPGYLRVTVRYPFATVSIMADTP